MSKFIKAKGNIRDGIKVSSELVQRLQLNFKSCWILSALDELEDNFGLRSAADPFSPPELVTKICQDLLLLHALTMSVINYGQADKAKEMFRQAHCIKAQIVDLEGPLDKTNDTLDLLIGFQSASFKFD